VSPEGLVGGELWSAFFVDAVGTFRLLSRKTCGLLDCRRGGSGARKPEAEKDGFGVGANVEWGRTHGKNRQVCTTVCARSPGNDRQERAQNGKSRMGVSPK
jgi:hypothetical protein